MSDVFSFTVFGRPEPQGSTRAFVIGGKARTTSANPKLKPWRSELTRCALWEMADQGLEPYGKHVPVKLSVCFTFRRPPSIPKRRCECVVKPDADKLLRGVCDALTGPSGTTTLKWWR